VTPSRRAKAMPERIDRCPAATGHALGLESSGRAADGLCIVEWVGEVRSSERAPADKVRPTDFRFQCKGSVSSSAGRLLRREPAPEEEAQRLARRQYSTSWLRSSSPARVWSRSFATPPDTPSRGTAAVRLRPAVR
jgi:hypothetical protein